VSDASWHAAYKAIRPVLTPKDAVLAPQGDWLDFPCRVTLYGASIEIKDQTVLLLHKPRMAGMRKSALAAVFADWHCLYANAVFIVMTRTPRTWADARYGWRRLYCRDVERYLSSRRLKRRPSTLYYVHVPKTGGTSVWAGLRGQFPSSVYYGDVHAFLVNPPEPGDYDLVGVHFSPSLLEGIATRHDIIAGMLRHPTERFISGLLHSRRRWEDPSGFGPSQRAMREMPLPEFLETRYGGFELRRQLILLGTGRDRPAQSYTDDEMLDNALAFLDRPNVLFAPSDRSGALMKELALRLRFRAPRLSRLNANAPSDYAQYDEEIRAALPVIETRNAHERRLYDAVCERFEKLCPP
jgi:hypothetical protein